MLGMLFINSSLWIGADSSRKSDSEILARNLGNNALFSLKRVIHNFQTYLSSVHNRYVSYWSPRKRCDESKMWTKTADDFATRQWPCGSRPFQSLSRRQTVTSRLIQSYQEKQLCFIEIVCFVLLPPLYLLPSLGVNGTLWNFKKKRKKRKEKKSCIHSTINIHYLCVSLPPASLIERWTWYGIFHVLLGLVLFKVFYVNTFLLRPENRLDSETTSSKALHTPNSVFFFFFR